LKGCLSVLQSFSCGNPPGAFRTGFLQGPGLIFRYVLGRKRLHPSTVGLFVNAHMGAGVPESGA